MVFFSTPFEKVQPGRFPKTTGRNLLNGVNPRHGDTKMQLKYNVFPWDCQYPNFLPAGNYSLS
jgi:hypothetical protein